ncbi:hypothetical protein ABG79_01398 [Caloramator mitchellensis]|uniref:Uncharacterized protein n=1 Tax=Caloramator mitchellensis TaxID=908809 RepID=A0A0R3JTR4_CALMK|nr:hypothetical protein [Caloramator mitchellensis]KRQ86907.1 hypothetical protein ABG79_01398 [Caloramator mitchellensis]
MISIKYFEGININNLQLIGQGTQGKVYKINSDMCIKIFKNKESCNDEVKSLIIAQKDPHFPRLYSYGDNFIIREFINGTELDKYLTCNPLSINISIMIIEIYEAMKYVGFKRLDSALFHIILTPSGKSKVIDTAKSLKKRTVFPYLILSGLSDLGYKEQFLDDVKKIKPALYEIWRKYL